MSHTHQKKTDRAPLKPADDHRHGHDHDPSDDHDHGADHKKGAHGHHHGPGHAHGPADFSRAFLIGILLNTGFVGVELIFGILAHSVALMADAGHNFSDVLGLVLAWWANALGKLPATRRRTYGFKRASILAALANAALLLVALGAIALEAVQRFTHPEPVQTGTMIWVASVGIIVNLGTAFMFMAGRKSDLNVRAAFLHMLADAGITVGVVAAAVVISITGWQWLDPALSLGIVLVILWGTYGLARDSVNMALDCAPPHVDMHALEKYLGSLPGVCGVHDLHVWSMSTTQTALTAHLVRPEPQISETFYADVARHLHEEFSIDHPTLQIEVDANCTQCRLAEKG